MCLAEILDIYNPSKILKKVCDLLLDKVLVID